jgi:hypothetical protein
MKSKKKTILEILNKYQEKTMPLHDEGVIDPMNFHKIVNDLSKIFDLNIKLPSDEEMDIQILKIMDENLVAGTKENNTEGIICNRFSTSIEIIKYIKKLLK